VITRLQRVRAAVFALVGGALIALVIAVFGGLNFRGQRVRYWVRFDRTVYGLQRGGDVYYEGVRVGAVSSISVDRARVGSVRVVIEIDRDVPIRADTHAFLIFAGITGVKEIDLRDSTPEAPPLMAGSQIQVGTSALDAFGRNATALADKSAMLIDHANELAANLDRLTSKDELGVTVDKARAAVVSVAGAGDELRAMLHENRAGVRASIESIDRAAHSATELVADLQHVVRANSEQVRATIGELHEAARSLADLARQLRQSPSRLIYSKAPPERKLP